MTELQKIAAKLKANPIYALSLGSRELFHTNLLAWLFINYPQTVSFFTEAETSRDIKVEREKHNLDLILKFADGDKKKAIVIEFKVKDAPRSEQLERYDETIQKHIPADTNVEKILISLVEAPQDIQEHSSWDYLSLGCLGEKLTAVTQQSVSAIPPAHLVIIENYCELCRDLHKLTQEILNSDEETRIYFLPKKRDLAQIRRTQGPSNDQIAEDIRFGDTLNKYRASLMASALSKEIGDQRFNDLRLDIEHGFDRKNAHVGATLIWSNEEKPKLRLSLGIHIQGAQYRRIIAFSEFKVATRSQGKNEERMKRFIDATDQWNWLFGGSHENGYFLDPSAKRGYFVNHQKIATRMQRNKTICSYAPIYLYQYANIGYADYEVKPEEVTQAVVADIQHARTLLSDSEYLDRYLNWYDVTGF